MFFPISFESIYPITLSGASTHTYCTVGKKERRRMSEIRCERNIHLSNPYACNAHTHNALGLTDAYNVIVYSIANLTRR